MSCNRCGGSLNTYELQDRVSIVCEDCGFIDVSVEHEPPRRPSESWTEAFARFYEKATDESDITVDDTTANPTPVPSDD